GECTTGTNGAYRIDYTTESFISKDKKTAELFLRVFTPRGKEPVFETEFERILFNASDYERIDVTIPTPVELDGNEFDRIVAEISPLIGDVKIADLEDKGKNRDVSFLSRETEIYPEKLEHVIVAHRLGNESKID